MQIAVQNKNQLFERIINAQGDISSLGVKRIGVFGSFIKNNVEDGSDVDFFVEFEREKKTFDNFMELAFFLENLTGRNVEIVTPESLNEYIGKYILEEVQYVPFAA